MQRFELVEGTSSKFWEVALNGLDVTVRFGRIGMQGQTKTKTFPTAAAAQKERDKLIGEKTGKGYAAVAVAPGSALAPAAAPAAEPSAGPVPAPATAAVEPPAAPVAPAPPVAPVPSIAPAASPRPAAPAGVAPLVWPQGGFDWTDALRAALPVVRGIHAPAVVHTVDAVLAARPAVDDRHHQYQTQAFADLAAALNPRWTHWDIATWTAQLSTPRLQQADPAFWLELCVQSLCASRKRTDGSLHYEYSNSSLLAWVTAAGASLHGLPFMVEVALDLARHLEAGGAAYALQRVVNAQLETLRGLIAASDDATHDAVIALLERQAGSTPLDRVLRAELCPHRQDWVVAGMAEKDVSLQSQLILCDAAAPVDALRQYLGRSNLYVSRTESVLLLQLHLHGVAAMPLLADLYGRAQEKAAIDAITALALRMHDPSALHLLVEHIERKEARAALDKLSVRYPAAVLKCVIEHALTSRSRLAEGWAVRLALREPAALAPAAQALDPGDRARFEALLAALHSAEAAPDDLPPLLRQPPWLGAKRASELPTLAVAPLATEERIHWEAGEQAQHAAHAANPWRLRGQADPVAHALAEMQIRPAGRARVLAGQPLLPEDIEITASRYYGSPPDYVLVLPDPAGLALWNSYPSRHWYTWGDNVAALTAILARHGVAALPGLEAYVQTYVESGLAIARRVDSPRLVPAALHALKHLKKAKAAAIDWLQAYPATALAAALPLAFGPDRTARDNAQFGVRWFVANGFEAQAREAAARYGDAMSQALQALLDADPLLVLPSRMPKLPVFFVAPSFRRPVLREGGGALPTSAMEHLGSMLAISKLDAPYPGLEIVKAACTPASLAEFAWDLFEAWTAAGSPSKEGWAFLALGLLGNDETARRLAPRIREWPGEAAHQRAVTGLDLLAAIGSDVALMHLNGIAGKVKFKALQDRAKEKIAAVAEARGFTAAELADRLVPDLGLDEQGTLALDFGPRQFFVGFDETLKPFVKDAQGVRLKDLPKPTRADDAALAEAATDRYKQLKKDAKAIASLQVTRLEASMVERRRWSAADFQLFFLGHPLMRHLAARVIWGVYDAQGRLTDAFRVAEDGTLADRDDTLLALPDDATVRIAHVLEMPAALQASFGQILADYEILQPFKQLARETYELTDAERAGSEILRFQHKVVASGSVMGLVNRGWERGQAQDAGWVGWFSKPVGDGLEVQLELDPGMVVGDLSFEPKQHIPRIVLRKCGTWDQDGRIAFDRLSPILASEVLRDAELLAPYQDA